MQLRNTFMILYILFFGLTLGSSLTGCRRQSDDVWEDSKSCGRHMSRGLRTMGGKHSESRAVQNPYDFMPMDDECFVNNPNQITEFVPLSDQSNEAEVSMADYVSQQPRESPGEPGSSIPGVEAFKDPTVNATWAAIFRNITFELNSNLVKGQDNMDIIHAISNYMKRNPNIYAFIEGHCDERGPEAYNLALGSRRGNAVRNALIQDGVNPDNVFTISYGKERPLMHDHNEEAWAQNRRAEFRIYQR